MKPGVKAAGARFDIEDNKVAMIEACGECGVMGTEASDMS